MSVVRLVLLVLFTAGAAITGALLALRRAWDMDSLAEVAREILTPLMPRRAPVGERVQRRIVRRLGGKHLSTPAGGRAAYTGLTVRLHPHDRHALTQVMPLPELECELAHAYLSHGRRRKWRLPVHGPHVSIQPDLRVSAGAVRIDTHPGALHPSSVDADPGAAGPGQPVPRQYVPSPVNPPTEQTTGSPGPDLTVEAPATSEPGLTVEAPTTSESGLTVEAPTISEPSLNMPTLCLRAHGSYPSVLLAPGDVVEAGRSRECQVRINDPAVSRRQARLETYDGRWRVVDLQSRNGTWLDGRRVDQAHLNDGDVLSFGQHGPSWTTTYARHQSVTEQATPLNR